MGKDSRQKRIEANPESQAAFREALRSSLGFFVIGVRQGRVKTDKELLERLNTFFLTCDEQVMLPTVEKMALALGMDVKYMSEIAEGRRPGLAGSFATAEILRQAKLVIASVDGELAATGKIQPLIYIWRSKNFYGMTDKQKGDAALDGGTGKTARELLAEADALPAISAAKAEKLSKK